MILNTVLDITNNRYLDALKEEFDKMCIKHKKKILTDKQYNEFIQKSLQSFDITFCNSETDFKRLLDN